MLRHLIEKGIDLNNPENNGVTPLMMAASQVSRFLMTFKINNYTYYQQ